MITRGGGDHAASERNEFDAVKTEVKNMKEDIKVILQGFEKTMKVMEENLHLAKEEICGAKARIEMLEAEVKKVVQKDDRGIPAVVTAPPQPAPAPRHAFLSRTFKTRSLRSQRSSLDVDVKAGCCSSRNTQNEGLTFAVQACCSGKSCLVGPSQ